MSNVDLTRHRALPLWSRLVAFLGPLILTNALQALSGTVTAAYLGHLLGAHAMAAALSCLPFIFLPTAFVVGFGTGASILVGHAWGRRHTEGIREIAGAVLVGGMLFGLVIGAVGVVIAPLALRWAGTPAAILEDAIAYARIAMLGMPATFLLILSGAILRGLGDSSTPLRTLALSCLAGLILTPALVNGWLGPVAGVAGAALASLTGTVASLAWLLWLLARLGGAISPSSLRPHLRLRWPVVRSVVKLGIPTGLLFVAASIADIALLSVVNRDGAYATATWGLINQVMVYVQMPAMSIGVAVAILTAQAIGGGHEAAQVRRIASMGLWFNVILTGLLVIAVIGLAPEIVAVFTGDPHVANLAVRPLRIAISGCLAFGLASVFSGVMRGAGTVRVPTLISLGCLTLLLFPLGWVFGQTFGVAGLWLTYPVTYTCALALQAAYFHFVWIKKTIERVA